MSPRAKLSAYTAKYRQRKRWAGLCIEHGCWEPAVGKCHCLEHKQLHTSKAREYRERRRACYGCGKRFTTIERVITT